jgi:hypothetical protein
MLHCRDSASVEESIRRFGELAKGGEMVKLDNYCGGFSFEKKGYTNPWDFTHGVGSRALCLARMVAG